MKMQTYLHFQWYIVVPIVCCISHFKLVRRDPNTCYEKLAVLLASDLLSEGSLFIQVMLIRLVAYALQINFKKEKDKKKFKYMMSNLYCANMILV